MLFVFNPKAGKGRIKMHLLDIASRYLYGILAQLGEHLPYKQRVIGSSPIGPMLQKNMAR